MTESGWMDEFDRDATAYHTWVRESSEELRSAAYTRAEDSIYRPPGYRVASDRVETAKFALQLDSAKQRGPNGWLTINCKPDVDLDEFHIAVQSYLNKTDMLRGSVYAFEQRSEILGDFHGWHVHILFRRKDSLKDSQVLARFKTFAKPFCLVSNNNAFHMKWIKPEEVPIKLHYLLGSKHGHNAAAKLRKVLVDIEWRKLNSIFPYYISVASSLLPPN